MSSYKPFSLALCLLCAALPARAEKPNDNRNDSSSSGSLQRTDNGYTKEWGGKSIHEWIRDLEHPDPTNRVEAMLALANFKQAADAIPDVLKRLARDGDASVRVKAALLPRMIPHHPVHRTRIITGLAHALHHDPQSVVRYEAAVSLQFYCPLNFNVKDESDVLQDLVAGLTQGVTYELREACIIALMKAGVNPIKGPDPRVTDALVARANPVYEAAMRVRVKAIMCLGGQGRPNDPKKFDSVMNVLKMQANYSKRAHPVVRIWAHVAVIALTDQKDNKKELDAIAEYLTHREATIRCEAVSALGALRERSQDYVDDVLKLLKRNDNPPTVKAAGAEALGHMKNTGAKVLSALIRLTEEDKPESFVTVWSACRGLAMLSPNSAEVRNAIDKVLEHKSLQEWQRMIIKKGIEEIDNPPKKQLAKDPPKNPDKGIAPKQNKNR